MVIVTIIGWTWLLDWLSFRSRWVHRLLHLRPVQLVSDGVVDRTRLEDELLTEDQLHCQLRGLGLDSPEKVAQAWLESNGRISVILRGNPGLAQNVLPSHRH